MTALKTESEFDGSTPVFNLESLVIVGLHGTQDVHLSFAHEYSIFIADNGAGKTTALFVLQCVLTGAWRRLLRYQFEYINIQFSGANIFKISRREIESQPTSGWLSRLLERGATTEGNISRLGALARHYSLEDMRGNEEFMQLVRSARIPSSRLYEVLIRNSSSTMRDAPLLEQAGGELERVRQFIKDCYNHSVIYLPTYRRVEQELRLLIDAEEKEESFGATIRFGMNDVEQRIETIGRQIRDHFVATYGQISGQMLHQLARESELSKAMQMRLEDRRDIEIVLQRLSGYVSEEDREHILNLYDSGELVFNGHLSFFLSNLIAAYEDVRHLEKSLQSFGKKCNQYLLRKEFRYDAASASLRLFDKIKSEPLGLNALSSGEKQIVGVLSQVYIGEHESYVVIFDEPELSLSVEWQRKILPDIVDAERCFALIAATHSPFIFENELDQFARTVTITDYQLSNEQRVPYDADKPR